MPSIQDVGSHQKIIWSGSLSVRMQRGRARLSVSVPALASVWPVQGLWGAHRNWWVIHGMQEVRGSTPRSSTFPQVKGTLRSSGMIFECLQTGDKWSGLSFLSLALLQVKRVSR
jgi:hypothetical protein